MTRLAIVLALALAAGCGPGAPGGPSMNNKFGGDTTAKAASPVVSADILAREPNANRAEVKHVLIGWKDLAGSYAGHMDKRAAARTKEDAEAEVRSLVEQLKASADFDAMMKAHSEDLGSATSARSYTVTPDAQLVIEFRQLSLRLGVGEVGVCESDFGFHIIKRLQ
jgi:hypothetical protein